MTPFLRRAAGDRKGAAAIEFALIFPVLFLWFLYRMIRGLIRAPDDRAY